MRSLDEGLPAAAAYGAARPRPRVLLIDPRPARLADYEAMLAGIDIECALAPSATDAVQQLLKHEFAAIVVEMSVPGADALATVRSIRTYPQLARLPILLVGAADAGPPELPAPGDAGAIDFIPAPVTPQLLKTRIALHVRLYRQLQRLNEDLQAVRQQLDLERAQTTAPAQSREREERYRAEKDWLAAVLNSMNEEVYFTDTQQRYTYANPAALREFEYESVAGVELKQIVRKLEVLRPDGTPRPLEEAPPLRALGGEVIRDEDQLVRIPRTGELRHRQVSSAPVRDANGAIIGSVSVVRDVTERKRIETELRASEQRLRDADRRKDEFIAVLAHELRNPLVPIRTGIELLKSARDNPALVDTIQPMMERQAVHMVRLIDDLLDVSRITSGKIELQRQRVTLASLITSAVETNRAAIASGNLDLSIRLEDPSRILEVDPTRFSQVVSNLLQNAAKFTGAGGKIAISARFEPGADGESQVAISVRDTGIGIGADQLPRVFDLFAQAPTSGQGGHAGLGIGLALARRLVELHGGRLDARSDGIGKGSEFTVRVPAPAGMQPGHAPHAGGPAALRGLRVLVVDDNRDGADVMGMLVGDLGAQVRVVYDGASAVASLDEFAAEIVLLDIGMPGMDGYETCRRIRGRAGASIALIAVTGWGQEQDRQMSAQAGFDAHVTKPADPAQLAGLLDRLRRRR